MMTQVLKEWMSGALVSLLALIVVASVQVACAEDEQPIRGTVLETMNSGGYTYLQLDRQGTKEWYAVPESLVKVGDEIQLQPGMQMGSYTSPTLRRTFDKIVFSGGITGVLKRVVTNTDDKADPKEAVQIQKAEGADAYTVAEVFEKKKELNGKKVVVRGKVVKTSQFEGLQWLRIVDGSGSAKRGNHKLVVTTKDMAAKDDIVTVRGTVKIDKAFGALTYEVVVEEAKVEKQAQ